MRGSSREPARTIPATLALSRVGLADDRLGRRGVSELSTRQVTLIQADHPGVVAHLARVDEVNPLVRWACVATLWCRASTCWRMKIARLQVGNAVLESVGPCHACSRLEEAIGPGGHVPQCEGMAE